MKKIKEYLETNSISILMGLWILAAAINIFREKWEMAMVCVLFFFYNANRKLEKKQQDKREERIKYGYMCMIDWQHEVGEAMGGNKIYPSVEDLKRNHEMWKACGIVKVSIEKVETVVEQDLYTVRNEDETN